MDEATTPRQRPFATVGSLAIFLAQAIFLTLCPPAPVLAAPPEGFVNEVYTTGLDQPVQLMPAPDGRIFIVQKGGEILVLPAGSKTALAQPFLKITNINASIEAGLLAMVLAPDFATTQQYYVYYTRRSPMRATVSRFTASGNTTILGTEVVVWQEPTDTNWPSHLGGGLLFGNDGKIYISTGEQFLPDEAQSLGTTRGKVLRVNRDGTIPADNPFQDGAGPNRDEVWAFGLRNPFRASIDKETGRIFVADVGGNDQATAVEKIHIVARGANYGWPECGGAVCGPGIAKPLHQYAHGGLGASITGGFIYRGKQFPAEYVGSYFFADYARHTINRLTVNSLNHLDGTFNFEPADGVAGGPYGGITDLREGLDGALYYADFAGGVPGAGRIRRIRYAQVQPPVVIASAKPATGDAPLTVAFSSAGSVDPGGAALTYSWDFGDRTSSHSANPSHTYNLRGSYATRLTVANGSSSATSDPVTINVGIPPVAAISAPAPGSKFVAGDTITFKGSGTDATLGNLPPSALEWTVNFRHEGHIHPVIGGLKGTNLGSFTIEDSGHDYSGNTGYEITLTVTGSNGLQSASTVSVFPLKTDLKFSTNPEGLQFRIDGIPRQAPFIHDSLVGFKHSIEAPPQILGGIRYAFSKWSDRGASSHTITVPPSATSLTATFTATGAGDLVLRLPFDEVTGSGARAADLSGLANNGTLVGGPARVVGIVGRRALAFNGTSGYVRVNGSPSLNSARQGITISAWVLRTSNQVGWRSIVSRQQGTGTNEHFNLAFDNNNFRWIVQTQSYSAPLGGPAPLGQWIHLAGTYDGAAVKLFVNGVQHFTTPLSGPIAASTNPIIIAGNVNAAGAAPAQLFSGRVDEVRIYNQALSTTEIEALMHGSD
jgi:glucose/arabinose dehydrogenase